MYIAAGGPGGTNQGTKFTKGIMEHMAANRDKSMFRHWHHKLTTALGQVSVAYEEIDRSAWRRRYDLGKEMDKIVAMLYGDCGELLNKASADTCEIRTRKTDAEAYDKIKMIPQRG